MKDAWLETYTGGVIHPFNPQPDEIDIRDIAHSLSWQYRFLGHTIKPVSVATHSINCARWMSMYLKGCLGEFTAKELCRLPFLALMHDAAEAYIGDIPRPVKKHYGNVIETEEKILNAIWKAFDVEPPSEKEWSTVKLIDNFMLNGEGNLYTHNNTKWVNRDIMKNARYRYKEFDSAVEAEKEFIRLFYELGFNMHLIYKTKTYLSGFGL